MEIWDAIRIIKKRHCTCNENCIDVCKYGKDRCVYEMSINALEKQIPYKPEEYEDRYYGCKCGNILLPKWLKYPTELMPKSEGLPYCLACGQKLDWEEAEKALEDMQKG